VGGVGRTDENQMTKDERPTAEFFVTLSLFLVVEKSVVLATFWQ